MRGKQWAREEAEKSAIAAAWYGEAFHRQKRLPDLETVLTPPDELAQQTPADMIAMLRQFQAAGADMEITLVEAPWLVQ